MENNNLIPGNFNREYRRKKNKPMPRMEVAASDREKKFISRKQRPRHNETIQLPIISRIFVFDKPLKLNQKKCKVKIDNKKSQEIQKDKKWVEFLTIIVRLFFRYLFFTIVLAAFFDNSIVKEIFDKIWETTQWVITVVVSFYFGKKLGR